MNRRCAALLTTAVVLTSAAADDGDRRVPEAAFTPDITADQFLARVARLASDSLDGRESATEGGRLAEEYVAGELAKAGLEPLSARERSPFTEVAVRSTPVPAESWIEWTGAGGTAERIGADSGSAPHPRSAGGEASGALVFAGFGIPAKDLGYDDYAGLDCRKRIVLALRGAPSAKDPASPWGRPDRWRRDTVLVKAANAAAQGAVGLLVVDDAARGESRTAAEGSCDTTPIPTFAVSRRVADRLLAGIGKTAGELEADIGADGRPRSAAVPGVTLRVSAKAIVSTARNVVFVRRGTDALLRDEAVLVCAHTDHLGRGPAGCDSTQAGQVHNGADDNASGTAAMIEVAEALAAGPPTKRSVVFAGWCAEERGLLGSEAFAGHPLWDLTRIAVVVNMDMVGRYRDAQPGDAGLTVGGMPTAAEVAAPMSRLAAVHGLRLTPSWQFFEQSDQFSFYRRGVPSLLLHTGLHADYHRAGDDWWKVEAEPGARIARLVLDLTRELADSPQRPQFAKRPPKPVVGARADDAAGGGVRLSEVLPGLGAAAAGLRAGDVVVALGGKEIEDVRDYHSFLGCAATGDVVEFVFLRDGKKLTASVRLAARD